MTKLSSDVGSAAGRPACCARCAIAFSWCTACARGADAGGAQRVIRHGRRHVLHRQHLGHEPLERPEPPPELALVVLRPGARLRRAAQPQSRLPPGSRWVRRRACLAACSICAAGGHHVQVPESRRGVCTEYVPWRHACRVEMHPGRVGSSAEPGSPEASRSERLRCGGTQGATTIALLPLTALAAFCVYLHSRGLGPTNISR